MQVKVSVLAVLLLAVLLPSSQAGITGTGRQGDGHVVSESSSSSDSSDSSGSAEDAPAGGPHVVRKTRHQDEYPEQDQDLSPSWPQQVPDAAPRVAFDQQEDNQALPAYPMRKDSQKMSHIGPYVEEKESQYKHGVAPAKLPARESDNAHRYRHSIIHPYGDDVHA